MFLPESIGLSLYFLSLTISLAWSGMLKFRAGAEYLAVSFKVLFLNQQHQLEP